MLTLIAASCTSDVPEDTSTGSISGSVSDRTTGEPISVATVTLSPGGNSTVTGSDGSFFYPNLMSGEYMLTIRKEGYNSETVKANVMGGSSTPVHITLDRIPASLKVDKTLLEFGNAITQLSFTIVNTGYTDIKYQIETGNCEWISVEPQSDVLSYGKTVTIIVRLDRSKLPKGENETILVVKSTSGDGNMEIKITATNNAEASVNTLDVSNIDKTTATLNGEVTNVGVPAYTERGFVYDTQSTPTLTACLKKVSSPVNTQATYFCDIEGLLPTQVYYARAYLIQEDAVIYGNIVSFTTSQQPTTLTTSAVTDISATQATLNGKILNAGTPAFTERGFCYSTSNTNPTISDNRKKVEGTSTGDYSLTIKGLTFPTEYYVRAYAIQSGTAIYGESVSFTTQSTPVTVTTSAATQVNSSSAVLNGSIGQVGSPAYTEKGFCLIKGSYGTPTINDTKIIVGGTGAGNYTVQLNDLEYNTYYQFRAYAIQNGNPVYGTVVRFTTSYTQASVITMESSNVRYTTATLNGSVSNLGDPTITERGFCYSTYDSPDIGDIRIKVSGIIGGTYKADITNLEEGTTYYYRAYVIQKGKPIYGQVKRMETGYAPMVVTGSASNVKVVEGSPMYWQAKFRGRFYYGNPGVTEWGFVYSENSAPTVGNSTKINAQVSETGNADIYEITQTVTTLLPYKRYYYRAYVKDAYGSIIYGDSESFTTY